MTGWRADAAACAHPAARDIGGAAVRDGGLGPPFLLIRYGGDEFLCAISGLTPEEAATRFAEVNASLATAPEQGSVTFGLAEMRLGDSPDGLVARADADLYRKRAQQRS